MKFTLDIKTILTVGPGSGKPEGGWPKGSMMDKWRSLAGRPQ